MDNDTTNRLRLHLIQTGDRTTCFGCGGALPALGQVGRGTSRWGGKRTVHLCGDCCTVEALRDFSNRGRSDAARDPFNVRAILAEAQRLGYA